MGLIDLKNHLQSGEFAPLYIVTGEESYLRRHYIALVREKLFGEGGTSAFDLDIFDGKTLKPADLDSALNAFPVAAERRLIIIRDLPLAKSNEIVGYLSDRKGELPESSLLIISEEVSPPAASSAEVKRFATATGAVVCEVSIPGATELCDWIIRYAAKNKRKISREDALYMATLCPPSLDLIKNELDKLIARCEKGEIRRTDIDEMVSPAADAKTWQLSEAVARGRAADAFRIIGELYEMKFDDSVVAATVYRAVCDLAAVKAGAVSGKSAKKIAEVTGIREFVVSKYLPLCRPLTLKGLTAALSTCIECDSDIKSKSLDKRARIEETVARVTAMQR